MGFNASTRSNCRVRAQRSGTAFAITEDCYFITNEHVVEHGGTVRLLTSVVLLQANSLSPNWGLCLFVGCRACTHLLLNLVRASTAPYVSQFEKVICPGCGEDSCVKPMMCDREHESNMGCGQWFAAFDGRITSQ